ncbi:MAG TPA: hypothetical protein VFW24_15155 [Acidimicrobiales bacterium]|nr:hypothetical protein [Acidimicrobiales bacterium]
MSKAGHTRLLAASLLGGGLLLAACSSSGSVTAGSSSTTAAGPSLSATPSALHFFLQSRSQGLFGPDGKAADPNQPPAVGDYFTDSDLVYTGNHSSHGATTIGSAHLLCAVTAVSGNGGSGLCDGLIDLGGSMLVADHQSIDLTNNNVKLNITGGTGRYQGAQGTLSSANVGNTNDTDLTISVSRPSGKAGSTPSGSGAPTVSTTPQASHYFQSTTEDLQFGPDGKALDQNAAPAAGDYFVSSDDDYTGNHTTHGKAVVGTDHLVCVLTQVAPGSQTGTGVCDGGIAFGNSMLVAEQQKITFSDSPSVTVNLTGGTGSFAGAHGTILSTSIANSDNSDVTITVSK